LPNLYKKIVKNEPSSAIEVSNNPSPLAAQRQVEYKRISNEVIIRPHAIPHSQKSKFFPKSSFQKILTIEDGFFDKDPIKFTKNIFPKKSSEIFAFQRVLKV